MLRLVALADDELGAAAANVNDEVRSVRRIGVMRNAEVNEARFLDAGDHFDRVTERLFGLRKEGVAVTRATQRVRAHDTNLVRAHIAEPLTESPQARERALLARRVEQSLVIE